MRNFFTQGHAQIVRDLILNENLDREDVRVIDFTYGTGSMWKINWPYKFLLIKCDAQPSPDIPGILKKDLLNDCYHEFEPCDAGFFDPPYLIGRQKQDHSKSAFDHAGKMEENGNIVPASKQGPRSWASSDINRFTGNLNAQEFIDRVKGLNRAAAQCIRPEGLLFVKVMDTRKNDFLFPAHFYIWQELTNFKLYANCGYIAIGSHTWKTKYEGSFGYWMIFRRNKK